MSSTRGLIRISVVLKVVESKMQNSLQHYYIKVINHKYHTVLISNIEIFLKSFNRLFKDVIAFCMNVHKIVYHLFPYIRCFNYFITLYIAIYIVMQG